MNESEIPSPNDQPHKISIHPRHSNHQTQNRSSQGGADFEGLILQLTRVLEDFRAEKKSTIDEVHEEEVPRIRQTGQLSLNTIDHGRKRRRRKRRDGDEKETPEFEKYVPGSRRRLFRRRKFLIVVAAVLAAFIASNYTVAKFFYRSGVSEGMRLGLEAKSAVDEKKSTKIPSPVFEQNAHAANHVAPSATKSTAP